MPVLDGCAHRHSSCSSILTVVPFLALVTLPLHLLVSLGAFVLWIVLLLKANQGQMYKLPMIGDMAEKQANAM